MSRATPGRRPRRHRPSCGLVERQLEGPAVCLESSDHQRPASRARRHCPGGEPSGATITQCNGSANGGTLVGLTCTASGTKAAAHGVTINQCNGSANGGGALVICSAAISNRTGAAATLSATTTGAASDLPGSASPLVFLAIFLLALGLVFASRLSLKANRN